MGGKDEYGVQTDEVEEFNVKDMKAFPGDWRLPISVSGFSCCLIKSKYLYILMMIQMVLWLFVEGMMDNRY